MLTINLIVSTDFVKIGLFLEKFLCLIAGFTHDVGTAPEVPRSSTAAAQVPPVTCGYAVYKVHVAASQQGAVVGSVVCIPGFLPTMKPQLSQLPLIVGYGRVSS
jgi:hypothetical protein